MEWTFHVAPIIKLKGELYILDPSVSTIPITKDDWYGKITNNQPNRINGFVTCDPGSYDRDFSYCYDPDNEKLMSDEYIESVMDSDLKNC